VLACTCSRRGTASTYSTYIHTIKRNSKQHSASKRKKTRLLGILFYFLVALLLARKPRLSFPLQSAAAPHPSLRLPAYGSSCPTTPIATASDDKVTANTLGLDVSLPYLPTYLFHAVFFSLSLARALSERRARHLAHAQPAP
jgi:hypothetical protein